MPVVKIRPRRQITIPKKIFDQLHLQIGDYIEAIAEKGRIIIIPKRLANKGETIPLTKKEQKILLKAKKKIDQIKKDLLHSQGLNAEEIKVACKVGLIDPDQSWWWTEEWQKGEREAEQAELIGPFDNAEETIKSLKAK